MSVDISFFAFFLTDICTLQSDYVSTTHTFSDFASYSTCTSRLCISWLCSIPNDPVMRVPRRIPTLITRHLWLLQTCSQWLSFVNCGWFVANAKLLRLTTWLHLPFLFYLAGSALPKLFHLHLDTRLPRIKVTCIPLAVLILQIMIPSSPMNLFSATSSMSPMVLSTFHTHICLASRRSKINGRDGLKKSFLPSLNLTLPTAAIRILAIQPWPWSPPQRQFMLQCVLSLAITGSHLYTLWPCILSVVVQASSLIFAINIRFASHQHYLLWVLSGTTPTHDMWVICMCSCYPVSCSRHLCFGASKKSVCTDDSQLNCVVWCTRNFFEWARL